MGEDGKIVYKVVINDDGVENEAEAAGKKAGDGVERGARGGTGLFKQTMIGAARAIGEAFIHMAQQGVQAVEQMVKAGIDFNAKMEKYQTGLTTLLGSEKEAVKVMEQIRKDAASTPFDVDSLTQANQMLISTGMSAGDARNDVLNLANAIAATGGGSAELSRMAANMQQVKNVGKATAMDIRQFAMAGINIYQLLADATGKTTEEVKDMEVSYDLLSYAFQKAAQEGGAYAGAMEAQSQTFNGRVSTLKDNILQLEGSLTQELFSMLSTTALPMVMDWVAQLLDASEKGGIQGAIQAAGKILSELIHKFLDGLPEMMETGVSLIVKVLEGFAGSGATGKIMAGVLTVIRALLNAIANHFPEILAAGISIIGQIVTGLAQAIPTLLSMAGELILQLFNAFINADWASIGSNIVNGIKNGIAGLWGSLVDDVQNSVNRLWNSAKNALGISSPSKKFKYIGEMSVEGMEEGFEEGETDLTRKVTSIYSGMLQAATPAATASTGALERSVSYNLSATGGQSMIVVPLYLDGREIARATAWSMGQQLAWEEM